MSRVFIGVGSNQGERLAQISKAVRAVGALKGVKLSRMATIIETAPVGGPPQGPYLNTVIEIDTSLSPRELLAGLKGIERQFGRNPSEERWAARPIDLDVLLYDDRVIDKPALRVPHERMHERRFVLEPLAQLAPDAIHPVLKQTIAELNRQVSAVRTIEPLND